MSSHIRIIINENGILYIERAGVLQEQNCPFNAMHCGDHCPLFGEPERYDRQPDNIGLCHGRVLVGVITDERPRL